MERFTTDKDRARATSDRQESLIQSMIWDRVNTLRMMQFNDGRDGDQATLEYQPEFTYSRRVSDLTDDKAVWEKLLKMKLDDSRKLQITVLKPLQSDSGKAGLEAD